MSTHGAVVVKTGRTEYKGIYVNFDGYPSSLGKGLLAKATDEDEALDIVLDGDHSFINEIGMESYADRGEDCPFTLINGSLDDIKRFAKEDCVANHLYVFENGGWTYRHCNFSTWSNSRKLEKVVANV